MNILELVFYFVIVFLTTYLHEYAHFLAYKFYGGDPKFGVKSDFKKFSITPYVTDISGDSFYWELFAKDRSRAWIKQLVLSGSVLFLTLFFGIVISIFGALLASFPITAAGLCNLLLFFANFISNHSDGKKIYWALKHREKMVDFLIENNYDFTPAGFQDEILRLQKKHGYNPGI